MAVSQTTALPLKIYLISKVQTLLISFKEILGIFLNLFFTEG